MGARACHAVAMELSLRRLQMLRELRRRGTVTAVAEALHYSTSGVSQQLAQLEREVGVELVERHGRRLQLTELGMLLSEHADEILAAVDRATGALDEAQEGLTARLTLGVWASVASGLVPTALASLMQSHPGVTVSTVELAPEETAEAVRDGQLDMSFVIDYSGQPIHRDPALVRAVVAVERLHAAAPTGMLPGETVSLAGLAEYPWILAGRRSQFGGAVRAACHEAGFEPRIAHTVEEQPTALAMAAGGLGVTLVSDLALEMLPPGVDILALEEPVMRTVSIAHRRAPVRPSLTLVVDAVRAAAATKGVAAGSLPRAEVAPEPGRRTLSEPRLE